MRKIFTRKWVVFHADSVAVGEQTPQHEERGHSDEEEKTKKLKLESHVTKCCPIRDGDASQKYQ